MSLLAPFSDPRAWDRLDREIYFAEEVRALRSTLDDIRNLPQTPDQESRQ